MDLAPFGWTPQRQAAFADHGADGLVAARVVGEHRSHFRVTTGLTELSAELTGRLRNSATQRSDLAGVGDFVALRLSATNGSSMIEHVLPRTSALIRKASGEDRPQLLAANVDVVFIVTAPDGDFNLARLARLVALVAGSGATPVIVLNKSDLTEEGDSLNRQILEIAPGIPVHRISARQSDAIAPLAGYFDNDATIGLVGSSGVGKSTLTNAFLGNAIQATQDVRAHDGRGRHTTTDRQLFRLPHGGLIIDTPGMRGVEVWKPTEVIEPDFSDVEAIALQCKFSNCRHEGEPNCAIRAAIKSGELTAERFASYRNATLA